MRSFFGAQIGQMANRVWQNVHQFNLEIGVLFVGEIEQQFFCASATFYLAKKVL